MQTVTGCIIHPWKLMMMLLIPSTTATICSRASAVEVQTGVFLCIYRVTNPRLFAACACSPQDIMAHLRKQS